MGFEGVAFGHAGLVGEPARAHDKKLFFEVDVVNDPHHHAAKARGVAVFNVPAAHRGQGIRHPQPVLARAHPRGQPVDAIGKPRHREIGAQRRRDADNPLLDNRIHIIAELFIHVLRDLILGIAGDRAEHRGFRKPGGNLSPSHSTPNHCACRKNRASNTGRKWSRARRGPGQACPETPYKTDRRGQRHPSRLAADTFLDADRGGRAGELAQRKTEGKSCRAGG